MEIKPFLPVVKKKNLQDKWTIQTLKIVKKNKKKNYKTVYM